MSTYPGEPPQTPDDQPADDAVQDTTEPTQPVGYWERQAAQRAAPEADQQGWPAPTTPYPQGSPPPGGGQDQAQSPPEPQNPYAPQGQQPYAYTPGPGGQMSYGAYTTVRPTHPQATLSMVLGLVGVLGALFACGLTLVLSPFAWALGHNSLREIRASQGRLGGESQARTGMITGIIGTILLVLAVLGIVAFIVLLAVADPTGSDGNV